MKDEGIRNVPINNIKTEPGSEELVRSEKMKPYLALLGAQMKGQDTEPYLAALAALPLEDRYVWRVISALKLAFFDLDTQSASADIHTLSEKDLDTLTKLLPVRAIQFCLFVRALVGQEAMNQMMEQALQHANDSSTSHTSEAMQKGTNATACSARQDGELLQWMRWSEKNGTSVVRAVVEAAFLADIPHYLLLRPVLLTLKEMHPAGDL